MAYRAKNRRSSRRNGRRSLHRNPLSTKQKLLGIGGIVVVGGVAAYALTSGPSTPSPPTGPTVDPRVAKEAECAALQASLLQLRNQPTPDRATMTRLEAQIATCIAQARELGANVDTSTSNLSTGDATFATMEGLFNEYKSVEYSDALRRNNIRMALLNQGAGLAVAYADAVTQSADAASTRAAAQSILRALDAAISRRLCFLGNERGCGTFGSNEDQPDAKAQQEQERVIVPLIADYMQAVTKGGGPGRARTAVEGERFLALILRPCTFLKAHIDGQFNHYKATEYSDALKRNNTRQSILAASRDLTACLQGVFTTASSFGSTTALRATAALTVAALNAAIDRWMCFFTGGPGCGTFAVNEDQPDVKAAQERTNSIIPLMALYAQIARALVARGDATAGEPLVTAKLRMCSFLNDAVTGQFNHYKATDYSDALKRNNTRQSILGIERDLVSSLQNALATALAGSTPASGMSGLGQLLMLAPMTTLAVPISMSASPSAVTAATLRMVRAVAAVVYTSLNASITRRLCFLYNQPGCGTFGVNEDQPDVKAAHEQATCVVPLTAVYTQIAVYLKDNGGDMTVAVKLAELKLRPCTTAKSFIDGEFSHYRATDYSDSLKRNNTRQSILSVGSSLVSCLQEALAAATALKSVAGVRLVSAVILSAVDASLARRDCYLCNPPGSGCGRLNEDLGATEDHGNDKAAQERDRVTSPLIALDRQAISFLVINGDSTAETTLVQAQIRSCLRLADHLATKYNELKSIQWDPTRQGNLRGVIGTVGAQMVADFSAIRPTTMAAKRLVKAAIQNVLAENRTGTEIYDVATPLNQLSVSPALNGLGDFMDEGFAGISGYTWLGLGAIALVAAGAYQSSKKKTRRNRRRTSRRLRQAV